MTEINVKIDMFPDPEFCEEKGQAPQICKWVATFSDYCVKYETELKGCGDLPFTRTGRYIKCDQCKAAYQKATGTT
jgi:hypothetical protein